MGAANPTTEQSLVILAIILALLVNLFFLFRVLPWARPGPWRLIWALAALFSLMFMLAEGSVLTEPGMSAADVRHQVPLFAALFAGAAGFVIAFTQGYGMSERSRSLALSDPLTSLPNLRAIQERLAAIHAAGERFALVYTDLDGFKRVNDRLGHAAGDDVLRRVGTVLRDAVRGADIPARVGGDEFVLLLVATDPTQAPLVARRVLIGIEALTIADGVQLTRHSAWPRTRTAPRRSRSSPPPTGRCTARNTRAGGASPSRGREMSWRWPEPPGSAGDQAPLCPTAPATC